MVDESLLLYLKNQTQLDEERLRAVISYDLHDDEKNLLSEDERERIISALEKVKILDPACGSGAFPIGALQKIVFILQQADPEGKLWFRKQIKNTPPEIRRVVEREFAHKNFDYIRKLGIIRENIYGVDIQPIATEISRLRCFLTLVVDERIQEDLENRGIEPLPNLDFKFVTANSLIGLPGSQENSQIGLFEDDAGIRELKELRDMFFNASGTERDQLKLQFVQAQNRMFQRLISEHRRDHADLTTKLTTWDPFSHKSSSWFDPEWMFGVKKGFDIVIANPPYINAIEMKKNFDPHVREKYKKQYNSAKGAYDIYILFFERGFQLLKENGCLSFITPNKYLSVSYAIGFREFVINNHRLNKVIDVSQVKVFAEVATYPLISFFQKGKSKEYKVITVKLLNQSLNDFERKAFKILINDSKSLILLPDYIWGFLLSEHFNLIKRILQQSETFISLLKVSATSTAAEADEYSKAITETQTNDCVKLINTGTIDPYRSLWGIENLTNKGKNLLKPYLNLNDGIVSQQRKELYKHPKIIVAKIGLKPEAFYDENGEFASLNTNCLFYPKDGLSLKYVLAYIHSTLFKFIYSQLFGSLRMGGGYYQFQSPQLRVMPIKNLDTAQQNALIDIVDKILDLTKERDYMQNSAKQEQVKELERQIDQMVYKLYGLTEEEIKTVEEQTSVSVATKSILESTPPTELTEQHTIS